MNNFSSFDASAALAARQAALLKATASESEETSGEEEGEKGDESGYSTSDEEDDRGRRTKTTSTSEQQVRRAKKEKEKAKRSSKKTRKDKESKEKRKKKKKRKRHRSGSRSRSRSPPARPFLPLRLPPPALYTPLHSFPDASTFSTVQEAVAAIDDAILLSDHQAGGNAGERIVSSVHLLLASGHAEAAAARVAAAAEFYFLRPEGLCNASFDALQESFERFWESGAALACEEEGGEGGGGGWKRWFDSGSLPLPPPLPCSKKVAISPEDASLAAKIAAGVDARVARLLPEGDATFPASLASRWARDERLAASLAWRPLRGPDAVSALAALSAEEAEGDPLLSSRFAPFASVLSAVSFTRDRGIAAAAVKELLSALGAEIFGAKGGGEGGEEEERWCLGSGERRRFLSRLLAALATSPSASSLLSDDVDVCWAALEVEAAAAEGEGGEDEGREREGAKTRNWPRARAAAKALLSRAPPAASPGNSSAGLWRAYARLQAVSGATSPSLKVTTTLLAALAGTEEESERHHALCAAVEAVDGAGGLSGHETARLAVLLVAAASGTPPAEVAVSPSGGAPAEEARAAALSSLEKRAAAAAADPEAAAAVAAAEALLLLLPQPASALAGAEAAARLGAAAEKIFGSSSSSSSSSPSSPRKHRRAFEWVVLRRCRLLARTAAPAEARSAALEALARFPESGELVDLLAEIDGGGGGGGERDRAQLLKEVVSTSGSPGALLRALSRGSFEGTTAAVSAIEHLLRKGGSPSSPRLFRALARAEVAAAASSEEGATTLAAATSRARRALLRGLAACPWCSELYLDLVDPAALLPLAAGGGGAGGGGAGGGGAGGGGERAAGGSSNRLLLVVPSGERAQLLEAAADAGVLLAARVDVYETALAVAAEEGVVVEEEEEEQEEEGAH